jgi:hypothetical protein
MGLMVGGAKLWTPSPIARSQSQVPTPFPRINMGHHVVEWDGPPGTVYEVRVTNPNSVGGREPAGEKAYILVGADENGLVRARLHYRTNDFNYAEVEPGDHFEIGLQHEPGLLDFVVPDFQVDVSDEGRTVLGQAPAGATVTLTLEADISAAPFEIALVADTSGSFQADLPEASHLAEGEGGYARLVDEGGRRYSVAFARRWVEITLDSTRIFTRASMQSPISAKRVVVDRNGRKRLRGFGVDVPRQQGFSTDGRRKLVDVYPYVLRAGETITVSQLGGALDRDDHWVRVLPQLAIRREGGRLVGQAPPDSLLEISVLAPDDPLPQFNGSAQAAQDGTFKMDLPPGLEFGGGWRALVRTDTGDGIWLRAEFVVPRFEASVNAARLGMDLLPFQPVSVTLRSADGALRYTGEHRADADGKLVEDLESGEVEAKAGWDILSPFEPGDELEIDLQAGDPLYFSVPRLSATTDPDAETISGQAEPGQVVAIVVVDGEARREFEATAGPDGRWQLDLSGEVDLEPGVYARVDTLVKGQRFYVYTAPFSLKVFPWRSYLEATPYLGYARSVTLTTPAGQLAGSGNRILESLEPPIDFFESGWQLDRFDDYPFILAGDTVSWRAGFDEVSLVVPPLESKAHIEDDLVVGRTIPHGRVIIETDLDDPVINQVIELVADDSGLFQHRFQNYDLRYNSTLDIKLMLGRHQVVRQLDTPGLALDLTCGILKGHVEPNLSVSATLGDRLAPDGVGQTRTRLDARFEIRMDNPDGRLPEFPVGRALQVEAPTAELTQAIEWRVPRVELGIEGALGARGRTESGAQVQVYRSSYPFNSGSSRTERPKVEADGSWQASFERPRLGPGTTTRVTALLPDGHIAERSYIEPFLMAHYGTDQVCGQGMPDGIVHVETRNRDGLLMASADGRVDRNGLFDLELRPELPGVHPLGENQRLSATIGGKEVAYDIGPMNVNLDLAAGRIRAELLPSAKVVMRTPVRTCLRRDPYLDLAFGRRSRWTGTYNTATDGNGILDRDLDTRALDIGLDIMVYTPEGHAYYGSHFAKPSGTAWVDEGRVTGLAPPQAELRLRLYDSAGNLRGETMTEVEPDTLQFKAEFVDDASGQPLVIAHGDRVDVEPELGAALSSIAVEDLSFDFDLDRGLWVQAPPGRRIELSFSHADGVSTMAETTDEDGRFVFEPDEVPPRAGWTFGSLLGIEVVMPAPDGNATGSAWRAHPTKDSKLWIPQVVRGAVSP